VKTRTLLPTNSIRRVAPPCAIQPGAMRSTRLMETVADPLAHHLT